MWQGDPRTWPISKLKENILLYHGIKNSLWYLLIAFSHHFYLSLRPPWAGGSWPGTSWGLRASSMGLGLRQRPAFRQDPQHHRMSLHYCLARTGLQMMAQGHNPQGLRRQRCFNPQADLHGLWRSLSLLSHRCPHQHPCGAWSRCVTGSSLEKGRGPGWILGHVHVGLWLKVRFQTCQTQSKKVTNLTRACQAKPSASFHVQHYCVSAFQST